MENHSATRSDVRPQFPRKIEKMVHKKCFVVGDICNVFRINFEVNALLFLPQIYSKNHMLIKQISDFYMQCLVQSANAFCKGSQVIDKVFGFVKVGT